jgi:hypothetical protein
MVYEEGWGRWGRCFNDAVGFDFGRVQRTCLLTSFPSFLPSFLPLVFHLLSSSVNFHLLPFLFPLVCLFQLTKLYSHLIPVS